MTPCRAGVRLHEPLEDGFQLVGGDADASVLNPQNEPLWVAPKFNRDRATVGEFHRVRDQVVQHLTNPRGITPPAALCGRANREAERNVLVPDQRAEDRASAVCQRAYIDDTVFQLGFASLDGIVRVTEY